MTELLISLGYIGLFIISFLAATILPLTSEVVALALPPLGYPIPMVIIVATAGNFLGTVVNWYVGKRGGHVVLQKWFNISDEAKEKAEARFAKYGVPALFFSWIPIIGDPLPFVAGMMDVPFGKFTAWVLTGKAIRYTALFYLVDLFFWQ